MIIAKSEQNSVTYSKMSELSEFPVGRWGQHKDTRKLCIVICGTVPRATSKLLIKFGLKSYGEGLFLMEKGHFSVVSE